MDTYREISPEDFDRLAMLLARITQLRENLPRRRSMASKLAAISEIKRLTEERRAILAA